METNDSWTVLTKQNVYNYLKQIDFSHPDFNMNVLKEQLSTILGVKPDIKMKWNTIETVNELKKISGAKDFSTSIDKLDQIEIYFIDNNNKIKNFKFIF